MGHRSLMDSRVVAAAVCVLLAVLFLAVKTPVPSVFISYGDLGFSVSAPEAWRSYPYETLGSRGGANAMDDLFQAGYEAPG